MWPAGEEAAGTVDPAACAAGEVLWVGLLMGRVEMGLLGQVFRWGLFGSGRMGCRDLRVGAGWIQYKCMLGRVGLIPSLGTPPHGTRESQAPPRLVGRPPSAAAAATPPAYSTAASDPGTLLHLPSPSAPHRPYPVLVFLTSSTHSSSC